MIGSSLGGNITQFIGLGTRPGGCLGVFSSANWLHQEAFNRYIERRNCHTDSAFSSIIGTEEADYGQDPDGWQYQASPISTRRFAITVI